jgi:hypothetical protein
MLGFHEIVRKKKCIKDKLQRVYVFFAQIPCYFFGQSGKSGSNTLWRRQFFPPETTCISMFFLEVCGNKHM